MKRSAVTDVHTGNLSDYLCRFRDFLKISLIHQFLCLLHLLTYVPVSCDKLYLLSFRYDFRTSSHSVQGDW